MTATKRYADVRDQPGYDSFIGNKNRWRLLVDGQEVPVGTDWKCVSPFGSTEGAVVVDVEGRSVFDRTLYREAPNVNVVAWGIDRDGVARLAVITQPRPHADDPEQPGNDHDPVVFGQIVMGFLAKIVGEDQMPKDETHVQAARREAVEEAGAKAVLEIEKPAYPWHNPNPTFVATWSDLLFLKVDLERVEALRSTRDEPIYHAEFITFEELLTRVRVGKDEKGAFYRMCTANSAWFIFLCCHFELVVDSIKRSLPDAVHSWFRPHSSAEEAEK